MGKLSEDEKLLRLQQTATIEIDCLQLICVISAIQLASRNTNWNGPSRDLAICTARSLQAVINDICPEQNAIIEMGWNPDFDI